MLYEDPLVVIKNLGHNLPIQMSDENFAVLKEFFRFRYIEKNGDESGYMVPYDHFDFPIDICED